ncbi:hypothetical protein AVEN_161142-1, partial [Araneus ventricosus]
SRLGEEKCQDEVSRQVAAKCIGYPCSPQLHKSDERG